MSNEHNSRYVVGIDLGTTNTALSYVDAGSGEDAAVEAKMLAIPQVVQQGSVETRELLPSFLYLPAASEQPAGALKLPWDAERDWCAGEFARHFGSQVPTRIFGPCRSPSTAMVRPVFRAAARIVSRRS